MTTHERERLAFAHAILTKCGVVGLSDSSQEKIKHVASILTSLLSEMGDGWIPVEEGLPGIGIPVLVTGHEGEGHMETANFAGRDDEGYFEWDHGNGSIFYYVTHWQPLPEGPKG